MRVGFIGTGSMGSILIDSFIQSGALKPKQISASNRSIAKLEALSKKHIGLHAAHSNKEVIERSDIIFICVKPLEFKHVIDDIKERLHPQQIVISITSPVLIKHLENQMPCKVAKIIPSITNYECSGASLCMYGSRIDPKDMGMLEGLLAYISAPLRIQENFTRITSDLSSCGPAFLCYFLERFIEAAVEETGIPQEEATRLASEMLIGTGKLITSGGFTPQSLKDRVTVPGGITAEGLKLMENEMGRMFNKLIQTTHAKYDEDLKKVESLFLEKKEK